ncbi:MAG TPA: hypothetical protein VFF40_05960 [Acidimicrobiia bacterium]|nr:hypothetical protein [Acidimicrobiia bacterium]
MRSLSRRSFLAVGGGLVLAACAKSTDGADQPFSGSEGGSGGRRGAGDRADGADQAYSGSEELTAGVVSIDPYQSTEPQRLGFVVLRNNGDFAAGPATTVALKAPGEARFATPVTADLHQEGLADRRGVYVIEAALAAAGVWYARLTIEDKRVEVAFQVAPTSEVVIPGQPAPRAPSPTFTETLGVDPICTQVPPCPLHTISLADAIGNGKPVAVMFATPARCQTEYCGPVLTQLLDVMGPYEDEIQLVHVEIYQNGTTDEVVSTIGFEPGAWSLPGEPWLFGIDGAGAVVSRLDGAFGSDEVTGLLDRLR